MYEYETDIKIVRERAVDKILEQMSYDSDDICHHDDFSACPATFCRIMSLFNIYPIDFMNRIREYTAATDEENPRYSFREYWEHFVEKIILEPNDFQILKGE